VSHTWFNVSDLPRVHNTELLKDFLVGIHGLIGREDGIVFSLPDHPPHIITIVRGLLLSPLCRLVGHIDQWWQRIAVHDDGTAEGKIKLHQLDVRGHLSSLAEAGQEHVFRTDISG